MKVRFALAVLLVVFVPLTGHAEKKKKPLALEVTAASAGLPLVTLTASDEPLSEVAGRLSAKLGTPIDVSPAARNFPVTIALDQQPLDLTLRELSAQAYVDGILTGGATGKTSILTIYLRSADEAAPPMAELTKSTSETIMFFGNTEDPALDPLAGQLDVTWRNDRLRVFAKKQVLSVVAAKIADVLGIPLELIGDSREMIDVSVTDATVEQAMKALTPSVKLYHRKDLATFRTTPVRLVVQEPSERPTPTP
ncbi:MAG TPA: hypothetical protein VGQ76_22065 [Thermoanaerobaculia bacterium]|jgi:type II secretory pathway component GspD/PulD (secretin)|nr:hypothetical protein [Thermoanaerobaculia bacterium]